MRQCYDRWLGRHSVDSFSKHNDLIFAGKHNQLKDMCRSVWCPGVKVTAAATPACCVGEVGGGAHEAGVDCLYMYVHIHA